MVSLSIGQRLSNSCLRSLILFELYPNSTINSKLMFLSGNKHETMIFHKTEFTLISKVTYSRDSISICKITNLYHFKSRIAIQTSQSRCGFMNTCLSIFNTKLVGGDSPPISRAPKFPLEKFKTMSEAEEFQTDSKHVCNYISSHLSVVKINQYHIQMYILMSKCFWTLRNEDIYQQWVERVLKF